MKLKKFQMYVATCLTKVESGISKKSGRPSIEDCDALSSPTQRQQQRMDPPREVRYVSVDHRIGFTTRGKCALCKKGFCETMCQKYNVRLCIKKKLNCFDKYHYSICKERSTGNTSEG